MCNCVKNVHRSKQNREKCLYIFQKWCNIIKQSSGFIHSSSRLFGAFRCRNLNVDLNLQRGHGAVGSAFEWHSKGQGFESPCLHHKNIVHLYDIFLCGIGNSPRFHRGVALQHEPLRADDKRRETQARSICGHRVQSHSQQIRHEVSAKGAVQRTICWA